jgi:hypothetical protein
MCLAERFVWRRCAAIFFRPLIYAFSRRETDQAMPFFFAADWPEYQIEAVDTLQLQ